MTEFPEPTPTLLLAEDDDGHAWLIEDGLRRAGVNFPVQRFRDGQQLLDFLGINGKPTQHLAGKSYLLLLDIRMPRVDGTEVLRTLKRAPHLSAMPILILTTTDDPREIAQCYALGCSGYLTKTPDFDLLTETLQSLGRYLRVLRLAPLMPEASLPRTPGRPPMGSQDAPSALFPAVPA